jgi:hypothetical protein
MQSAGLTNFSSNMQGLQLAGILNKAENVKGLQISGIYNRTKRLKGIQVGLINKADTIENSFGIGVLNFYKNGYKEIELTAGDYQNIGVSFRSGTHILYTIINIGYNFGPNQLFSSGVGLGSLRKLKGSFYLKPELVYYYYVFNDLKFKSNIKSTHFKAGLMYRIKNTGITFMPSLYYANIPGNLQNQITKLSFVKELSQTNNSRWGYGLSIGISTKLNKK